MNLPTMPTPFSLTIFAILVVLLAQREILRAAEVRVSPLWTVTSNSLIGLLLMVYGFALLARFLSFMG
jgi:hypothetical protein